MNVRLNWPTTSNRNNFLHNTKHQRHCLLLVNIEELLSIFYAQYICNWYKVHKAYDAYEGVRFPLLVAIRDIGVIFWTCWRHVDNVKESKDRREGRSGPFSDLRVTDLFAHLSERHRREVSTRILSSFSYRRGNPAGLKISPTEVGSIYVSATKITFL